MSERNLVAGFVQSARRFPNRPALSIAETSISYSELADLAVRIGATLRRNDTAQEPQLTGVFGHRSLAAFAGILGSLMIGRAYVPLNPSFPEERTRRMIEKSGLRQIVAERASLPLLLTVLRDMERPLWILVVDGDEMPADNGDGAHHEFLLAPDLEESGDPPGLSVPEDALAYLLFTSGSTGDPKGVMVTHANVTQFVAAMSARYDITEQDRLSQTFDLTFDLSVFDMFMAWEHGACVCCPTRTEKLLPGKYVTSQNITLWFSVPSTAIMMRKLRMLQPGQYPNLRYSLFCGEALPLEVADAFQQAAPNSVVENLYGPTELTIACTAYRFDAHTVHRESELGVVPIGEPYPGMTELVVDEELRPVPAGTAGELLMAGPQVAKGYWQDQEKSDAAFVVPSGQSSRFYRTGDRVKRRSPGAPLLYLGRVDNQIKIQGYRVELGEIEAVLREAAQVDTAIAVGYPGGIHGAEGLIAFVAESSVAPDAVRQYVQRRLPGYMQPAEFHWLASFPLNANGKVDRGALLEMRLAENPEGHRSTET